MTGKTRLLIAIAAFASMAVIWIASVPTEYDFSGGVVDGWEHYGKDEGGKRYSRLDQINRENVGDLEVAWEYHTGDLNDGSKGGKKSTFETTPVIADGLLYLTTVHGLTIALDPTTGAEIWKHDPAVDRRDRDDAELGDERDGRDLGAHGAVLRLGARIRPDLGPGII